MRIFRHQELLELLKELQIARTTSAIAARLEVAALADPNLKKCLGAIARLEDFAREVGFGNAAAKTALIRLHYDGLTRACHPSAMEAEVRNALDVLYADMWNWRFLSVRKEMVPLIDCHHPFGESVTRRFPLAANDLREAGNCLAADCNTAAVFHLMRGVEFALRAFCVKLGFTQVKAQHKASGKHKYVPVEYSTWEKVLDQLQPVVDLKVEAIRSRIKKQEAQEFYYSALQEFRAFKDAWRNHVMHTRRVYSAKDAGAIRDHVERFMVTLASR